MTDESKKDVVTNINDHRKDQQKQPSLDIDSMKNQLFNQVSQGISEGKTSDQIAEELISSLPNMEHMNKDELKEKIKNDIEASRQQVNNNPQEIVQQRIMTLMDEVIAKGRDVDEVIDEFLQEIPDNPEIDKSQIRKDLTQMLHQAVVAYKKENETKKEEIPNNPPNDDSLRLVSFDDLPEELQKWLLSKGKYISKNNFLCYKQKAFFYISVFTIENEYTIYANPAFNQLSLSVNSRKKNPTENYYRGCELTGGQWCEETITDIMNNIASYELEDISKFINR